MSTWIDGAAREQLAQRRERLQAAIPPAVQSDHLKQLLQEVDDALERLDNGTYGLCEECHEAIETDRLLADPVLRYCLDHLSQGQQRALEQDLELASMIQGGLLPPRNLLLGDFQVAYYYEAAGPVSGDYCDLVSVPNRGFYFMLGDVAGKGIAASMLMAHLHAAFRTLIPLDLPLDQMLARASRLFCESTLPSQFATLVCGWASLNGDLEICNAGHPPPLLLKEGLVTRLDPTGLPLGMFCNEEFQPVRISMGKGDVLIVYTDGVSEADNRAGSEYGVERIGRKGAEHQRLPPQALLEALLEDHRLFRADRARRQDDLTLMAIQRVK